jgi:hypothetical protein
MLLNRFFKESNQSGPRAEVHYNTTKGYVVEFYGFDGSLLERKIFETANLSELNMMAEDWVRSVNILNG